MAILAPTILYCARYLLVAPILRWSRSRLGSTMTFTIYDLYIYDLYGLWPLRSMTFKIYDLYDLRPSTIIIEAVLLKIEYVFLPSGQILPPMEPPPNRFYR